MKKFAIPLIFAKLYDIINKVETVEILGIETWRPRMEELWRISHRSAEGAR